MEREIYRLREERKGVSLEGSLRPFARVREFTAVRLIENGKMGSALAEGSDEAEALRLARETLRFSSEEDYRLPTGCKSRWKRTFEVDVGDLAREFSALADELGNLSLSSTVELITRSFSVESTAGADVEGSYSFLRAELEIGGGLSFQVSAGSASKTELTEFIRPYLGLIDRLDEIAPPKGKVEAIFAPTPLYTLLLPPVLWKFRGRTAVSSPGMEAKEGEVLASPLVTVLDDPLDRDSLRHVKADDEGVRARKNFLIEKGIAKGLLWDSYTAWKAGRKSTGNGIRIEEGVFDGPHNLTLAPGRETLERMIEEVGKGFLALGLRGANALDPVTGNFSVVVTPALIIEGGEVKGFSRFELRGNVWGLLKTTTGVGSELTRVWLDEGLSLSLPFLRAEVVV
ncbi:TldD/PmbA family protein [Thermococcus thioreducens]|uniref:Peptidase n=1 Tax=Thermococcus thioreducens TaxID=277988 RepID=A0A0Q2ULF8_9EURY|nr:metallopeptidase TldD-related protein [Thermococcus thioreducens]ASJ12981.1 peptidase [Thermococcus thioreducens]KQH81472.1 peptidase [Thermococcus thioreducens]SEV82660.1 PmbA protein [Thermococcus thioreducens]